MGTTVTTHSKTTKFSYKRLKKLFNFYDNKKKEIIDQGQLIEECYKEINKKQLLHEEINKV